MMMCRRWRQEGVVVLSSAARSAATRQRNDEHSHTHIMPLRVCTVVTHHVCSVILTRQRQNTESERGERGEGEKGKKKKKKKSRASAVSQSASQYASQTKKHEFLSRSSYRPVRHKNRDIERRTTIRQSDSRMSQFRLYNRCDVAVCRTLARILDTHYNALDLPF